MKHLFLFFLVGMASISLAYSESSGNIESGFLAGYNKAIFKINDGLDAIILKPVAKGYRAIAPEPVEQGVVNFFSNLGEITNVFNDVLQGKGGQALNDSGRFLINTTVGIVGFFDVASNLGLEPSDGEDFGQTMGAWGIGSGAYVVLPLLGPSSFRDAPGLIVDSFTNPIGYVEHVPTRNSFYGSGVVSVRTELLDAEELISGDKYQFIKDAYLQRREFLVNDGDVEDDFGSYDDY